MSTIAIPQDVRNAAKHGLELKRRGFAGGTQTGWDRAEQLSGSTIDPASLADMRTWFARHGPDASNGGTSYVGYLKWIDGGSKTTVPASSIRGAVSWLLWGGDPAYRWLKSDKIRDTMEQYYPSRKASSPVINLRSTHETR